MHDEERPPGARRLHQIPEEPWKNGKGTTRELSAGPHWRVSVASVVRHCAFSLFPGMTRHSTVVAGGGLTLRSAGDTRQLGPFEPCIYDGAVKWTAELAGGPVSVLNVMVSEEYARAEVTAGTSFRVNACAAKFFLLAFGAGCFWKSAGGNQVQVCAGEYLEWDGLLDGDVHIAVSGAARGMLVLVKLTLLHQPSLC